MQRLFTLAAACIISSALAFSQAPVTEQPQASTHPNPNSVSSVPNSNGGVPSTSQSNAIRTPATPNQALPTNAATEGGANGQAITPSKSRSAPAGMAAGNTPNRNEVANNPTSGTTDTLAKPSLNVTMPWLWAILAIVAVMILIGILMRRDRSRGTAVRRNKMVVPMSSPDRVSRNNEARKAS